MCGFLYRYVYMGLLYIGGGNLGCKSCLCIINSCKCAQQLYYCHYYHYYHSVVIYVSRQRKRELEMEFRKVSVCELIISSAYVPTYRAKSLQGHARLNHRSPAKMQLLLIKTFTLSFVICTSFIYSRGEISCSIAILYGKILPTTSVKKSSSTYDIHC